MAASLERTEYFYGSENALQNVAVWEFPKDQVEEAPLGKTKYWLIFLHGGAWRDPRATFNEAEPTINALLDPSHPAHIPHPSSRIAAFASINYRLSPHPEYVQDEASTPSFARRAARHPDHLVDALSGLRFLQHKFGGSAAPASRYVLFGHSAGGFLGYQVLVREAARDRFADLAPPTAVVGFEGIYDLVGLNGRMEGNYTGFMEAAFGPDEGGGWARASPATTAGQSFGAWGGAGAGRLAVLAHSPGDELVDMADCDAMEARLKADGVANVKVYRDLKGGHFEVLGDGSFARVLKETLEELESMEKA
ncbi:alpha/beta-hydrolase [Cryphonectria parasitica EP155]|uniref:Kynurenine formamidase n=1 Tax=Cryphonectria parasitica (strain ATCC 38755 / EP155) TaxID=660469 RepID=A0A9P4YC34_CRYP1|nr:alpha/beta-hydrolase [Cryphonectria parasitica EP155]KAF3770737.1 alpha/beta-hydrolase [Cryphonectria parasitica EP155]